MNAIALNPPFSMGEAKENTFTVSPAWECSLKDYKAQGT